MVLDASPIRARRVEHLNIVHDDYDATVEHYRQLFGGVVVFDRLQPTWHACLMEVGGVLFEIFVPNEFFLHTRYGPHYLGVEYHVDDMAAVRETLAACGIRIARDLDVAVHTHPADCHGVSLEFFDDSFHENDELLDRPMQSATYWRDEHPLGCTGLHGYTVAVADLATALADFQAVLEHDVRYEVRRETIGGTAVGLEIGGAVLELVAPDGDGPLQRAPAGARRRHPIDRVRGARHRPRHRVLRRAGCRARTRHGPRRVGDPGRTEPRRDLRVRRLLTRADDQSNRPKNRVSMLAHGTGSCTVASSNDTCSELGVSGRAESNPTKRSRSSTVRSGKYHHS